MKNIILSFIFLTAISFTSCSNKSKNNTSTTTEISKDLANKEISFGGVVTDVQHRVSKQGKGWALFTIEDYTML